MKTKTFLISLLVLLSFKFNMLADSPITSTPFSDAYQNEPIVIKASQANGLLTIELMDFMIEKSNPIAIKMAVINKIGWDIDGRKNAITFLDYLKKKKHFANEQDIIKRASADELLCIAYLKAMDNYFEVDHAIIYSDAALKKNPKSYTFQIITALIKAQKAFDSDWCKVYKLTDNVRKSASLNADMNEEGIRIIFEYMDLYYCEQ